MFNCVSVASAFIVQKMGERSDQVPETGIYLSL